MSVDVIESIIVRSRDLIAFGATGLDVDYEEAVTRFRGILERAFEYNDEV